MVFFFSVSACNQKRFVRFFTVVFFFWKSILGVFFHEIVFIFIMVRKFIVDTGIYRSFIDWAVPIYFGLTLLDILTVLSRIVTTGQRLIFEE